jgi:hypothetical protein
MDSFGCISEPEHKWLGSGFFSDYVSYKDFRDSGHKKMRCKIHFLQIIKKNDL